MSQATFHTYATGHLPEYVVFSLLDVARPEYSAFSPELQARLDERRDALLAECKALEALRDDARSFARKLHEEPSFEVAQRTHEAVIKALREEARLWEKVSSFYSSVEAACVSAHNAARDKREAVGRELFEMLTREGWEAGDVDQRYPHKRWGGLGFIIESNARFQGAQRAYVETSEARGEWLGDRNRALKQAAAAEKRIADMNAKLRESFGMSSAAM